MEKINYYLLFLIFVFAISLRLIYLAEMINEPIFNYPLLDEQAYDQRGMEIREGKLSLGQVFFQSPLYPYFLGFIYYIFGHKIIAVKLIQFFLGAISAIFIFFSGFYLWGKNVGYIAAFIAAMFNTFIFYEGFLLKSALQIFLLTAFLALFSRILTADHTRNPLFLFIFFAGICWGLLILLRENLMLVAPFLFIGLCLTKRSLKSGIVLALGIALPILPVSMHNYWIGGELILITAQGGQNFYIGNNPFSDGASGRPPTLRKSPLYEREDFRREAEKAVGRKLSEKEVSHFWFMEAVKWIKEHPWDFLRLLKRKFFLMFGHKEVPDNRDFDFYKKYSMVMRNPLGSFAFIFPLGIVGMIAALAQKRKLWHLYLIFILYSSSCILFHIYSRYRQIINPILILFSAFAIQWIFKTLHTRDYKKLFVPTLIFLLAILIVLNSPAKYSFAWSYYNQGYVLMNKGDLLKAEELFKKALEEDINYAEAYNNLGIIYLQMNRIVDAKMMWERAIQVNPNLEEAHNNLGYYYIRNGDVERAMEKFQTALKIRPHYFKALYNLGNIYMIKGLPELALKEYQKARELEPEDLSLLFNMALALEKIDPEKAVDVWKKFIQVAEKNKIFGEPVNEAKERLFKLQEK